MSFGFKVNRADGTEQIGPDNTILRHMSTESFAFGETATRTIPEFDESYASLQWTTDAGEWRESSDFDKRWMINPWDQPAITINGYGSIQVSPPSSDTGHLDASYSASIYEFG